jgi:hypothetical protein
MQCDLISGDIQEVERNQTTQTLPVLRFDHNVGDVSGHRIDHHAPHLATLTIGAQGGGADSYDLVDTMWGFFFHAAGPRVPGFMRVLGEDSYINDLHSVPSRSGLRDNRRPRGSASLGRCFLDITETGAFEHSTQVDYLLGVDGFVRARSKRLGLVPDGDEEFPVVSLFDLCHRPKERCNRPPLNVVTDRVLEDLGDGFSMMPAQMTALVRVQRIAPLCRASGWHVMIREHG